MIDIITKVIADNEQIVLQVKAGKEKAINQLVGAVLKQNKMLDPAVIMRELRRAMGLEQVVKVKKEVPKVAPVTGLLTILKTKHEGGTLYRYQENELDIEFTISAMDADERVPEKIKKYINSTLIRT